MKSNKSVTLLLLVGLIAGCGGGGGSSDSATPVDTDTSPNVVAITVPNDQSYPNKPTVSVTVCEPGTSNCKTVNNVLLDTGSYGLRIFKDQVSNLSLQQVVAGSASIAECVPYLDGTGNWGPVKWADVKLGGETAGNIPIQIIDASYSAGGIPPECQSPNATLALNPADTGYNGILGVGLFAEDCGTWCARSTENGMYFNCNGANCTGTIVPITSQVRNPVSSLSRNNNGVVVQMQSIPTGGAKTASGKLILGIGTETNNTPSGVTTYKADDNGNFITVFNNTTFAESFIDSGSNGLFFPAPASLLPICSYPSDDWYCPQVTLSSPMQLEATNSSANLATSGIVEFKIGKATSLFNTDNSAFAELGGPAFGSGFDWGLPFFYSRSVFVGINGKSSVLGTGPYWAY